MILNNEQFRIEWVANQLKKLPQGLSILDAGAGEQQYRKYCDHLVYTSQDFAAYDPKGMETGLQMGSWDYGKLDIISDITSIPRPDNSFDVIFCTEVFEHIPDPVSAIKEFARLLKPGGKLIITAPFSSMTHFAPYHFSTGFSKFFYEHYLPFFGFEINELTPNGNYFSAISQELGRVPFVAENYNLIKPNRIQLWSIKVLQKLLVKYSFTGTKSSELLCFGWHCVAQKK